MTSFLALLRSKRSSILKCVALIGCTAMCSTLQAQPLRLAVSEGPVSLPIYVANSEHYFEREGVDVELLHCNSGLECYAALERGEANLATAAELVMTLNSTKKPETAIIATVSTSRNSIKLVARSDAGISAPEDLRGKRIGRTTGTSAQYFLDSWLVFQSIEPASVTTVPLAPGMLVPALEKHEVDAVASWDPVASSAMTTLGEGGRMLPVSRVYTQHFSLFATRKVIVEQGPSLIKMLRALERAERFIANHQESALLILISKTKKPIAPGSFKDQDYRLSLEQSLITTMDAQVRWATSQGLLPNTTKASNLLRSIEPSLLRTAVPESVNLVQ